MTGKANAQLHAVTDVCILTLSGWQYSIQEARVENATINKVVKH